MLRSHFACLILKAPRRIRQYRTELPLSEGMKQISSDIDHGTPQLLSAVDCAIRLYKLVARQSIVCSRFIHACQARLLASGIDDLRRDALAVIERIDRSTIDLADRMALDL